MSNAIAICLLLLCAMFCILAIKIAALEKQNGQIIISHEKLNKLTKTQSKQLLSRIDKLSKGRHSL